MTKLTKRSVETLKIEAKDYFVSDSQIGGFGVRVMPSGAKTYQAQYRKGGRTRRVSLGRHGKISAEETRKLAREVMGLVAKGENPASTGARQPWRPYVNGFSNNTSCSDASYPRKANIAAQLIYSSI